MKLLTKLRGDGSPVPGRPDSKAIGIASLGGFIAIGLLGWLSEFSGYPLVLGSFGASVVLIFCLPDAPVAQPRNIIGGHVISSFVGLLLLNLVGPSWWGMALAIGAAIALMMLSGTVHHPGGANAVIVFMVKPEWSFLVFPTLAGAVLLVVFALAYNNLTRPTRYPKYW